MDIAGSSIVKSKYVYGRILPFQLLKLCVNLWLLQICIFVMNKISPFLYLPLVYPVVYACTPSASDVSFREFIIQIAFTFMTGFLYV